MRRTGARAHRRTAGKTRGPKRLKLAGKGRIELKDGKALYFGPTGKIEIRQG